MNTTPMSGAPPDSPLRALVALCGALARRDQAAAREQLRPGRVDWTALRQVADRHRLTGYLSAHLHGAGARAGIAPDFLFHARHVYLQQWVRNGQLLREMERIARRLEADRLPYLFFKGPLLANRLYDQLGSRAIHDIDLLIPLPQGMARYDSALGALGYRRYSRLLLPLSWSRFWLYQLEYKSDRFTLEPHWALQRHPSLRLDTERMWRERVMLEMPAGAAVPALADEYTLLANLLSIPADLQNASLGLRTYFELYLLWRLFPASYDWPAFWERRRAERTQRLTRVVLALLRDLFGPAGLEAPGVLPLPEEERPLVAALGAQLFGTAPSEWRRRQLAFRLFEAPLPVSLLWWSLTLPARALAHPAVTRDRLRRW